MNSTYSSESNSIGDDMEIEYQFDYLKAKSNRFAPRHNPRVVILDEDVASVFNTSNSVNNALRSLIESAPQDT